MAGSGWIGVDLDGTLAHFEGDVERIGKPVPKMAERVRAWLAAGIDVRIVTARVSGRNEKETEAQRVMIELWSRIHFGQALTATCTKDASMLELWDDRAVAVDKNSGKAGRFVGGRLKLVEP